MSTDHQQAVREFHEAFGLTVNDVPTTRVSGAVRDLRIALLQEETDETVQAARRSDLVEIADGLADVLYIAYGTAVTYGIPLDAVFAEVHRSNMSKLGADGRPIHREDGKALKGPNYSRPDVARILREHMPLMEVLKHAPMNFTNCTLDSVPIPDSKPAPGTVKLTPNNDGTHTATVTVPADGDAPPVTFTFDNCVVDGNDITATLPEFKP